MKISGSQMVVEALKAEGVKVIYGYPGGAIMNIYDEVFKQDYFEHILVRHEQAAIHAAEGHAKSTGKTGVAFVTSGPGFTNAVTGLADAYMDSVPIVVISGQVPLPLIGTDAFQEIDAVGISRPCTKHNYLVKDIEELPRILKEAFYIANSGRPGPVHVDIPKDITAQLGDFEYPKNITIDTYKPTYKPNIKQIEKAAIAIKKAKKPVLYIGGGVIHSNATKEVRELATTTSIPALTTLKATGVISCDDPNFLGMVGMHGTYAANKSMSDTDLMVCIGARFDDRVTGKLEVFGVDAEIIHIDIDPASIGKLVEVDYPIVGDVKLALEKLIPLVKDIDKTNYAEWVKTLEAYKKEKPTDYQDADFPIKPQWVIQTVGKYLENKKHIIATDVGQHQMWTAQFYPFKEPREFLTSGGLGTMGFGLPAAMGAKRINPDHVCINFTGDGSILMNIQELMTCTASDIPVINIILNNNHLGMVRQWQTFFYENRFSSTPNKTQPDFVKLTESFGGVGYQVNTKEEFHKALKDAIDSGKVAMINVAVDEMENVLPMVPANAGLDEMMLRFED
ncbi:MAG: Acetolactate synthase large subunit (EC [uncultured Campylobacterales bacterium]|uniref:Acetolactate synthase n=1 Tax=uncultured Campylobacterales bacterium TaxID=352960 RepID=A0A6S6T1N6_9BACT|nr:MAG: Acetolactate synthase large subunit (EC [uncultured Campylobacterales bacterium]